MLARHDRTATRAFAAPSSSAAQQPERPVPDGGAVMDFCDEVGEDPEFKAFRARSWIASENRWEQTWFDTVDGVFPRFEGGPAAGGRTGAPCIAVRFGRRAVPISATPRSAPASHEWHGSRRGT